MSDHHGFDAKSVLNTLPRGPGVYRMLDAGGKVIYVGKARNLKRRVSSYFNRRLTDRKTIALVAQIRDMAFTLTHTEAEALILENNLIKQLRPRYNVLLRDDKSYPFIYLSSEQAFPRLAFHRGAKRKKGRYFGPFPSSGAVRETLNYLQKVFPVRQCEDSFFAHRSRPCLQYQIKRCTAPCVGFIDEESYARDVRRAEMFLDGKSQAVIADLVAEMEQASDRLDFEAAAVIRDRIAALRKIQERQYITGEKGDLDVVAADVQEDMACVQVFVFRGGRNLGNKTFYPKVPDGETVSELLAAFLARYYLGRKPPREIVISHEVAEAGLLSEALSRDAGYPVAVKHQVRSARRRWLELANNNVRHAIKAQLATHAGVERRLEDLQDRLGLPERPSRLECFDISHTRGESTVASCVVFNEEGPLKSDYRRFNIEGVAPGDDYAAMFQALTRRYTRVKKGEAPLPDVLVIDGGKGQMKQAREVLEEIQIEGVTVIAIAKGPSRKAGEETLFVHTPAVELHLPPDSPGLHLLQQIRDEAHRFAITGHRGRRGKKRRQSVLEDIPGLGPKRRQTLLKHFGGLQGVVSAGVEDLSRVPGVSATLAQKIYDVFHGEAD